MEINQIILLSVLLIFFVYYGGKYVPTVLKQNKQILLGVVGGLVLASFFGFRLEGYGGGVSGAPVNDNRSSSCGL